MIILGAVVAVLAACQKSDTSTSGRYGSSTNINEPAGAMRDTVLVILFRRDIGSTTTICYRPRPSDSAHSFPKQARDIPTGVCCKSQQENQPPEHEQTAHP